MAMPGKVQDAAAAALSAIEEALDLEAPPAAAGGAAGESRVGAAEGALKPSLSLGANPSPDVDLIFKRMMDATFPGDAVPPKSAEGELGAAPQSDALEAALRAIRERMASNSTTPSSMEYNERRFAQIERNISALLRNQEAVLKIQARERNRLSVFVAVWSYAAAAFAVSASALVWLSGTISILVPIAFICVAAGVMGSVFASSGVAGTTIGNGDNGRGTNIPSQGIFR